VLSRVDVVMGAYHLFVVLGEISMLRLSRTANNKLKIHLDFAEMGTRLLEFVYISRGWKRKSLACSGAVGNELGGQGPSRAALKQK
jgi:hypothetical protein